MTDLQKAIDLTENTSAVFAAVCGDKIYTSDKKGISALLGYVNAGLDFSGMSAADSVVGKAAAMLMVRLNIKRVHVRLVSLPALEFFKKHAVEVTYNETCDYVINRAGDGMCPMEETVLKTDDIDAAIKALNEKLASLKGGK